MVEQGSFRKDLYYWLNIVEIDVPPLRERMEDLEALVEFFVTCTAQTQGLAVSGVDGQAISLLKQYSWPGNVLELRQAVERACLAAGFGELNSRHFAFLIPRIHRLAPQAEKQPSSHLGAVVGNLEKSRILEALGQCRGNKSAAAKLLGLDRAALYRKIKKYKIE